MCTHECTVGSMQLLYKIHRKVSQVLAKVSFVRPHCEQQLSARNN
eukprot:COSAG03_NODE_12189_length_557_cov_1.620087_1_plen_44_part_10